MTKIKYVGRPSLDFYGKYLSEIANNLCDRGIGRVVIKESETRMHKEPCFYVIKKIEPLMSDPSGVRCRAFAERVFRGHNFGVVPVPNSHEPDWRLLSIEEGEKLQGSTIHGSNRAPYVPVKCVAPMPPVLAIKLRNLGKIPKDIVAAARQAVPSTATAAAREGDGYLLLTKIFDNPTLFQVPMEPTEDEKRRVFPSYHTQVELPGGLVRKTVDDVASKARNVYYIRRSDTPGLRWRVELADTTVEDDLLQLSPSSVPPQPPTSSDSSGLNGGIPGKLHGLNHLMNNTVTCFSRLERHHKLETCVPLKINGRQDMCLIRAFSQLLEIIQVTDRANEAARASVSSVYRLVRGNQPNSHLTKAFTQIEGFMAFRSVRVRV